MFKASPHNSPIYIINGRPKVYRYKKGKQGQAYTGSGLTGALLGFLFSREVIALLAVVLILILLFIMIGTSFVLWLLPLLLMRSWAFKRAPRPPGALPVFFLCLLLTIIPGTLGFDGLNKQDGWNWFHLYEQTIAKWFPGHKTTSVELGYGIVPAWLVWLGYRVWLWYSDTRVVAGHKRHQIKNINYQ